MKRWALWDKIKGEFVNGKDGMWETFDNAQEAEAARQEYEYPDEFAVREIRIG